MIRLLFLPFYLLSWLYFAAVPIFCFWQNPKLPVFFVRFAEQTVVLSVVVAAVVAAVAADLFVFADRFSCFQPVVEPVAVGPAVVAVAAVLFVFADRFSCFPPAAAVAALVAAETADLFVFAGCFVCFQLSAFAGPALSVPVCLRLVVVSPVVVPAHYFFCYRNFFQPADEYLSSPIHEMERIAVLHRYSGRTAVCIYQAGSWKVVGPAGHYPG